jgi:DNA-binding transcriptional ArsR family regulator
LDNQEKLLSLCRILQTLADANRLLIISELGKGELSVNELVRRLELQVNVSSILV